LLALVFEKAIHRCSRGKEETKAMDPQSQRRGDSRQSQPHAANLRPMRHKQIAT